MTKIRIGTRKSKLALRQAELVQSKLSLPSELVTFDTKGDLAIDSPLFAIGSKGLFTAELEEALKSGEINLAVHSLKDLPTSENSELPLVAITERESAYDCLVLRDKIGGDYRSLADLPVGTILGTSSLRRRAFLKHHHLGLEFHSLRGNIETRLRKISEGVDGIAGGVMAYAGLRRLDKEQEIICLISPEICLPAPGQGALAIQANLSRITVELKEALKEINHPQSAALTGAERASLRAIEGGCLTPFGALAELVEREHFRLSIALANPDGSDYRKATVEGKLTDAEKIGFDLGLSLKGDHHAYT
ncbi:MAG: hydroxymethylbilane synthase [Candidatus Caenarcaniphilales bacterium]|nr:hydroxymethylbilane synthase [Candidatus Caenarcaniphilales bacterium]